jgi:hypothetical protein
MRLPADLPLTSQARQTLDYFGGYSARATLSQMPRRAPIRPSTTQRTKPQSKPFNVISQDPTVSPYLNLHRNEEDNEAAPNYYSFVRPQIEQLESNRRQRLEVERLERQLQSRSSSAVMPQSGDGGWPAANSAARYMDTAQFYGGWPR